MSIDIFTSRRLKSFFVISFIGLMIDCRRFLQSIVLVELSILIASSTEKTNKG
ncbi:hypothetical protein [Vibrio sp. MA40-2]|uniref:hypothetical protein n=1 Tax=Vibrio sp. MA40-2 TaxID=3391828 RepID=UPI0039A45AD8